MLTHLPEKPAYEDYALLIRRAAQVIILFSWPEERIEAAGQVLERIGVDWSPLGAADEEPPWGLMCFWQEGTPDGTLEEMATALTGAGIGTFSYELFHDHEVSDADFWRRVGGRHPRGQIGVLFLQWHSWPEQDRADRLFMYGSPEDLETAGKVASDLFGAADPVEGPDGVTSVDVELVGDARIQLGELVDALELKGFHLHETGTNHTKERP